MAPAEKVYPVTSLFSAAAKPPVGAYYSVKDQPLPPPSTYRNRRRRSGCSCLCCLGTLCSIFVIIVISLAIAAFVFWIVVRPQAPKFDVQNVRISNLTNFAPGSSTVSPVTTFEVQVRNPNKKIGIYYDRINVNLQSLDLTVGQGSLEPFYQGHKNTTVRYGNLTAPNGVLTLDSSTQTNLLNDQSDGSLPILVAVNVRARVKLGSWTSRRVTVKVRCSMNVNLNVLSGSQLQGSSRCKIKR